MWNNYLSLLAIAALLRADYEMRRPQEETSPPVVSGSSKMSDFVSRQDLWARKAVRRYAEAQEKKWRHWNKAMFEKSE